MEYVAKMKIENQFSDELRLQIWGRIQNYFEQRFREKLQDRLYIQLWDDLYNETFDCLIELFDEM